MGLLVDGKWHDQWYDTSKHGGKFVRESAKFRNWVTADGTRGPSGTAGFKAAADRYHLYVSRACPWAHRTLIFRALKGLDGLVPVSVVHPDMLENGWEFRPGSPQHRDELFDSSYLHQIYTRDTPDYTGRVTVPVLWDKQQGCIVSNESADIIRMFNGAFDSLGARDLDLYPDELRDEIESVNKRVYETVNNGVYRAGFATSQEAYEEAYSALFDSLDWLEERLQKQRYLVGNRMTEADWRLFTTLARFDAVYFSHFKCNRDRIADFPALGGYLADLYNVPGVAGTVDFAQIKRHYYHSQRTINPSGIVPVGPALDLSGGEWRAKLGEAPPGLG
ncbi:glutathione S-transferase family protein [Hydrocarboniclastica marina]|uniref:Glutathione S-transferase family protein n=1 Tax=Hydrocarboniclastica marina TaxID=2259620 RepID=A0A4P7XEV5_9ALTE|nr:glutathione S-transferase family protein [Hydrocarboniclastica marina]QCF25093.1 glutathione S-transferase family protein [Hydrocarboniclastica marina]